MGYPNDTGSRFPYRIHCSRISPITFVYDAFSFFFFFIQNFKVTVLFVPLWCLWCWGSTLMTSIGTFFVLYWVVWRLCTT